MLNAQIPGPPPTEQIVLDKVEVNPPLNDAVFTRADLEALASGKNTTATAAVKPAQ